MVEPPGSQASEPFIGAATARDLGALAALDRRLFGEVAYPFFVLRQAWDALGPLVRVLRGEAGDLIGYAMASIQRAAPGETPPAAWIWALAVAPEHRRRGLARLLLEDLLTRLTERGARAVRLHVAPANGGARRLYGSLGFEELDRVPDCFGPGEDRLILGRELP